MSQQMKLLGECSGSIDSVRKLEHKLKEEEENFPGFVNLNSTEMQTAGECILGSSKGLCHTHLPWFCFTSCRRFNPGTLLLPSKDHP